jgi:hypothetical protein
LSRWVKSDSCIVTGSDFYKAFINITLAAAQGYPGRTVLFIGHAVMNFEIGDGYREMDSCQDAIPKKIYYETLPISAM